MTAQKRLPRRRPKNDPYRKQRIIAATARVMSRKGIDGVTFRAVSAEADVPLGSITYHFNDREHLLLSTVLAYRSRSMDTIAELTEEFVPVMGLAEGLARMIEEITVHDRARFLENYSVYLGAFHRESLRSELRLWHMDTIFRSYADPETAEILTYLVEGIFQQAVMLGRTYPAASVAPLLKRAVSGLEFNPRTIQPVSEQH